MKKRSIYFFVGTNAEYIKLAPIFGELKKRKVPFKLITSGQSEINYQQLKDITKVSSADIEIKVLTHRLSLPHFILWMIKTFIVSYYRLRREFSKDKPGYLIVHGDTASSLIGAILAKIFGFKLVHVESGLRSFHFLEPFPEEINRFIISHLADIRFAQNTRAYKNIKNLGGKNINTKENTLIESYNWARRKNPKSRSIKIKGKYYLLYIRRQEHIVFKKDWTRKIINYVINSADDKLTCIFVLHPLTSNFLKLDTLPFYKKLGKKLMLVSSIPYVEYMHLMANAEFMVADGCTNQEEAYYMGIPFLALRNRTERTEGVGKNVVISKGSRVIIKNFFGNYKKYKYKPAIFKDVPSRIIVDTLLS